LNLQSFYIFGIGFALYIIKEVKYYNEHIGQGIGNYPFISNYCNNFRWFRAVEIFEEMVRRVGKDCFLMNKFWHFIKF